MNMKSAFSFTLKTKSNYFAYLEACHKGNFDNKTKIEYKDYFNLKSDNFNEL